MTDASPVYTFAGGRLCLDFCNTISTRAQTYPHIPTTTDKLTSYSDLVAWSQQAGILTAAEAAALASESRRAEAEAEVVLDQAVDVREAMFRIFVAHGNNETPHETDLATFNTSLANAMAQARVRAVEDGFVWDWPAEATRLDRMLWPIVRSAADLLVSSELERVRQCGGEDCTWLFLDTTRNHSRRWCDMRDCGNRAKARRHYQRQRQASG
jgi:predicted RNA-binding Zn ribbon-like protein